MFPFSHYKNERGNGDRESKKKKKNHFLFTLGCLEKWQGWFSPDITSKHFVIGNSLALASKLFPSGGADTRGRHQTTSSLPNYTSPEGNCSLGELPAKPPEQDNRWVLWKYRVLICSHFSSHLNMRRKVNGYKRAIFSFPPSTGCLGKY